MSAKDRYLKNKKLAGDWNTVVKSDTFEDTTLYVRARFMETGPTREELIGAEHILHIMTTIAENEDTAFEFPSPGLHHEFEKPKPKPEAKK
jgi:hypothetical protein